MYNFEELIDQSLVRIEHFKKVIEKDPDIARFDGARVITVTAFMPDDEGDDCLPKRLIKCTYEVHIFQEQWVLIVQPQDTNLCMRYDIDGRADAINLFNELQEHPFRHIDKVTIFGD